MASISVPCPKTSFLARVGSTVQSSNQQHQQKQKISFPHAWDPKPSLLSGSSLRDPAPFGFLCYKRKESAVLKVHAQLNKAAAEKSSNSAPVVDTKAQVASTDGKDESAGKLSGQNTVPDAQAISAFMTQVSDLVKLVDSRDIMELQLKQLDCELIIRKKEALQQPAPLAPVATMPPHMPYTMFPTPPVTPAVTPAPASSPPSAPAVASAPALPSPAKASGPSHPPLKCPMAGTFYRCPAPGEPPFVKVGDKVQKGQVICIIEAMKLMNEIEAEESGTVTEILAEDAKPVSVDMPLFVIVP